jgi:hypothetical protein
VNCLITGLTATSTAGGNDVDGGLTSIQSPAIRCQAGGTITLRFRFFFAHLNNATNADLFRVRVVGSNGVAQTVGARRHGDERGRVVDDAHRGHQRVRSDDPVARGGTGREPGQPDRGGRR